MRLALILLFTCSSQAETLKLTLEQARELALSNHPSLAALDYSARAAAELPKQIRSTLSPQLSAGIAGSVADDATRLVFSGLNAPLLTTRIGGGLQLNQLISDFGRTRLLADSYSSRADAQKEVIKSSRLQILAGVDRAYYSILRARVLTRVSEQTIKARQLVVDQVSALTSSQLRSTVDLAFARVNLTEAQILLSRANNELDAAEADLTSALGLRDRPVFEIEDHPLKEDLPPEAEPLVVRALAERPELRELALELQAGSQQLSAEKKLALPTINFQGVVGGIPLIHGNFPNHYGAAGISLTVPILNGKLFQSRQAEVSLRIRSIEKQREDRSNRIARDVRTAFLNARSAFDRIHLTEDLLAQSRLSLDLAQSRYDLGLGSMIELSQAQLNQTAAEVSSSSARYEYQILRSILRYQLGEGVL